MTGMGTGTRRGALIVAGALLGAVPAFALAPGDLAPLKVLEKGRWHVADVDRPQHAHDICLGDVKPLLQPEHRGVACTTEVVRSEPGEVIVQYSCPGRGFGRTSVRVETPRLARITTQGMDGGRPFSWRGEARRTGRC